MSVTTTTAGAVAESTNGHRAISADVRCVIGHLHTSVEVADAACRGRFHHAGVTLDIGPRPDWLRCGLDHDEEWRIELVKLYEGLDLAHAFAVTADRRHLQTWENLVTSFVDQVPVGHDSADVTARRIQNWLYAAQRFRRTDAFAGFSAGFERVFVDRIVADLAHLRDHLTPERNHRTLEIYALLVADLALGDHRAAAHDLELLADNAATDIWDDGVHRECSSDYHLIVLRSLVGAIANASDAGLRVPDSLRARTSLACDVAMWLHRPDGTTPALSDGDRGDFRSLLELAGSVLHRDDLTWVATGGQRGTPPTGHGATFATGGYVFWRSGWQPAGTTPGPAWGVFDCGPLGDGGHGHYDQLSVELVDGTTPLVVDPGRYTYADGPDGWRHWFKGTAAHNTVTVDGLDQVPYRRGKPLAPLPQARLVGRAAADGVDVAVGSATSPSHDAVHTRAVALVDGRYWIVHDRLDAPTTHTYAARWHLASAAWQRTSLQATARNWVVTAPGVRLLIPRWCGSVRLEQGWDSPTYGVKAPAPVVVAEVQGAGRVDLCTAIGGTAAPAELEVGIDDGGVTIGCRGQGWADRLGWGPGATTPWRRPT